MKTLGMWILGLVMLVGIGGCAELQKLKDFTVADAKLAQSWAAADGDKLAEMCYAALIDVGANLTVGVDREPIGALSGEYLIRHFRKEIESAKDSIVLQKLRIGCGPLLLEKRDLAIKLGLKLGIAGM
jgi:hypothetical protein